MCTAADMPAMLHRVQFGDEMIAVKQLAVRIAISNQQQSSWLLAEGHLVLS